MVISINAWMNHPAGFTLRDGKAIDVHPLTALFGNGTSATSTTANNVLITGSGSHDSITVGPSVVQGNLAVALLGSGGNSTSVDDVSVAGQTALMAAGGANTIAIDNLAAGSTFGGSVGIFMEGTNNILEINSHNTSSATTTFH